MTIEQTGTPVVITPTYYSDDATGAQSITVPADCDIVIAAYIASWSSSVDWLPANVFDLGGINFTRAVEISEPPAANDQAITIEYLVNPSTGSQTLNWNSGVHAYNGTVIIVAFYKGVDTSSPIKDTASGIGNDLSGMTYDAGDMMVGCLYSFNADPSMTQSLQTQVAESKAADPKLNWGGMAQKIGTGAFDTTSAGGSVPAAAAIILTEYVEVFYEVSEEFGLSVIAGATSNLGTLESQFGFSGIAEATKYAEYYPEISDGIAFGDTAGGINYSSWLRHNRDLAVYRYHATITGAADSLDDYELTAPKSIQLRMRSGDAKSYLSFVIPYSIVDLTAINARSNGELIIYMAAIVGGIESLREELLRADLYSVRFDRGAKSQSISIVGYKSISFGAGTVTLENVFLETMTAEGLLRYRCAVPDFYLRPGHTAKYGANEFTVDTVGCFIGDKTQFMEVSE